MLWILFAYLFFPLNFLQFENLNSCENFHPKNSFFSFILIVFVAHLSLICCHQYELRLAASDNLKENYTTVVIHVKDVNE